MRNPKKEKRVVGNGGLFLVFYFLSLSSSFLHLSFALSLREKEKSLLGEKEPCSREREKTKRKGSAGRSERAREAGVTLSRKKENKGKRKGRREEKTVDCESGTRDDHFFLFLLSLSRFFLCFRCLVSTPLSFFVCFPVHATLLEREREPARERERERRGEREATERAGRFGGGIRIKTEKKILESKKAKLDALAPGRARP